MNRTGTAGFSLRSDRCSCILGSWVFITVGSSCGSSSTDAYEFFLLSPSDCSDHVETLTMAASYHADQRQRVGVGSVVEIGRPWLPGSAVDHLLVSLPYPFGPRLEHLEAGGRAVRVLWLVAITGAEAEFARTHGHEALEHRLDKAGVDVIDPDRPSVI